jgi:cytochrome c biogenesis protein CcmG/thiol:disulfide interchange protein DsbE
MADRSRFAFFLVVFVLPFMLPVAASPAQAASAPASVMAGSPAPAFTRPGLDGKPVSLKSYRGKVVLVDFWASWCPPCIIEIPQLIGLQKKHGARLQIIGVSMDDDVASARDVARRFAFNYPLLMGDAKFGHLYGGILGLPSAFLIGRDGRIVKILRGELKPGELDRAIQDALG